MLAGLAGTGGGGAGLITELTRPPTKAEMATAAQAEVASRWQRLTAAQIFPAAISYRNSLGATGHAARVGIAPDSSCAAALDPPVAQLLRRHGCLTVLRATYLDGSGMLAATVGIVVMRGEAGAQATFNTLPEHAGLRVARFPGTQAALLSDANRAFALAPHYQGPYLFLAAAGSTDGRPVAGLDPGSQASLNAGLIAGIQKVFTGGGHPCTRRDIRC